jgi:serine-type D-Ala-D-Ala carboxypeptidase (penicillin-binding protein 5/6)
MRRASLAVVMAAVALAAPVRASTAEPAAAGPQVQASSWYLVGEDGAVLARHDANLPRAIASITKLMTAVVVLEHAGLDDVVRVDPRAASIGESTVYLRAGEELTVSELLRATLVPSANDAAEALALYVGHGSAERFVALMNAKAAELGLTDTHFENPHGLDQAGHVSSARDMTTLLTAALRNSFIRTWSTRSTATIAGGRSLESTDDLLSRLPLLGAKTGHTDGAGWSQVAAIRKDGVRITASVLGASSEEQRNADLADLLEWGLAQYHPVMAVDSRRVYGLAETGYGRAPVKLVAQRDVVRTIRVGRPLVERVVAPTALTLPVARGERAGEVRVYDGQRLVARVPLVAATAVSSLSTAGKVGWYARRTLHHLGGLVT